MSGVNPHAGTMAAQLQEQLLGPGSVLQKDEGIPYHTAPRNPNIPAELGRALGSSWYKQPWSLRHPCDVSISVHICQHLSPPQKVE